MAFWGIQVKPGKPFTHLFDPVRGRLRISQATLGIGSSTKTSLLQCNIGNRSPVLLCALLPDKTESCHLDLEFEEAEEVIFSVIGPRSVHLTGYYFGNCRRSYQNVDSESYGEDIANTESGQSARGSDEDKYEDSFINDSDPEVSPPFVSNGRVVDEEMFNVKKPKDKKGRRSKRLKKKYQSIESDDDNRSRQQNIVNGSMQVPEPESEDEDKFPISVLCKSKTTTKDQTSEVEEKADKETGETVNTKTEGDKIEHDVTHVTESIIKADVGVVDGEPESASIRRKEPTNGFTLPSDEMGLGNEAEPTKESQEPVSEGKTHEADSARGRNFLSEDKLQHNETLVESNSQDPLGRNEGDQKEATNKESDLPYNCLLPSNDVGGESHKKSKKKRKGRSNKDKTLEDDQNKHSDGPKEEKAHKVEANNMEHDMLVRDKHDHKPAAEKESECSHNSPMPSMEMGSEDGPKPKKRKEWAENGKSFEAGIANQSNVLNKDHTKQDESKAGNPCNGLSAQNELNSESIHDKNIDIDSNQLAGESQSKEKKIKKKKKKSRTMENENVNLEVPLLSGEDNKKSCMEIEDKNVDEKSSQTRTLSSGLIVEEVETGKPDAKMAVPGKKVKVHYIGKLKENGKIFDSNMGKAPFRFRLGGDDVIEGWNLGLEGMRIGGKRRLIIPPSMGYGSQGAGENIPPNSWLVYEVELLGVR